MLDAIGVHGVVPDPVLAAAVPLESVFLGKLLGMFGVAVLFVAFWATVVSQIGALMSPSMAAGLGELAPAVGGVSQFAAVDHRPSTTPAHVLAAQRPSSRSTWSRWPRGRRFDRRGQRRDVGQLGGPLDALAHEIDEVGAPAEQLTALSQPDCLGQ